MPKFTIEFEFPVRKDEGKVTGLSRMLMEARRQLRERVEHPERFKPAPPEKQSAKLPRLY